MLSAVVIYGQGVLVWKIYKTAEFRDKSEKNWAYAIDARVSCDLEYLSIYLTNRCTVR
jgi:hypothetical protein